MGDGGDPQTVLVVMPTDIAKLLHRWSAMIDNFDGENLFDGAARLHAALDDAFARPAGFVPPAELDETAGS